MEVLILTVILGLGFAFFATQNIAPVVVNFANYSFNLPLYLVVIFSILVGLFLSLVISLFENISASLTIWGKEAKINQAKEKIAKLNKQIDQLERENIELKSKKNQATPAIRSV